MYNQLQKGLSKMQVLFSSNKKTKIKKGTPHKILLPINRKGYRFLKAINKIRVFLDEAPLKCIPGADDVDHFMQLLFGTKYLRSRRMKIDVISVLKNKKDITSEFRISMDININENKKEVLADYLRTAVIVRVHETDLAEHISTSEVLLPKAISNFIFNYNYKDYNDATKIKSLESQVSEGSYYKHLDLK